MTQSLAIRPVSFALAMAIVILALYGPLSVAFTPKAHAIPVTEVGANLAVNTTSAAQESTQTVILNVLNGLAWTVAKTTIQSMTYSIVNWINSGFEGSPAFVTDLNHNLRSLSDAVAEDFFYELDSVVVDNTGLSIRAPFQDQINDALREEYYRTTSSYGFNDRYAYSECYDNGNFSWDGWFCKQDPANNPWERYNRARNELWSRIDTGARNRMAELDWGNGFLSWRGSCGPYGGSPTAGPGGIVDKVDLSSRESNYGCRIRTPGTIIEDQLIGSLDSPLRQLELADSINEVVGALMNQMVNQVLGGGGLSGLSQPSSGGGASYLDRATSPTQYGQTTSLADGLIRELSRQRSQVETYLSNWQRIGSAASSAQQSCPGSQEAASVVAQANTNISRANSSLAEIDTLRNQIATSRESLSSNSAETLNDYQSLLSGSSLPLPEEIAFAQAQSQVGDSVTKTLYTQMVELARTCR